MFHSTPKNKRPREEDDEIDLGYGACAVVKEFKDGTPSSFDYDSDGSVGFDYSNLTFSQQDYSDSYLTAATSDINSICKNMEKDTSDWDSSELNERRALFEDENLSDLDKSFDSSDKKPLIVYLRKRDTCVPQVDCQEQETKSTGNEDNDVNTLIELTDKKFNLDEDFNNNNDNVDENVGVDEDDTDL